MPDRFPSPWKTEIAGECYRVTDAEGHPVAYVYFDDREHIGTGFDRPTKDQARRIAAGIARVPDQPQLSAQVREAIGRFIAQTDPALSERDALELIVSEYLTSTGLLPLPSKDRGKAAGRR